MQVHAADEPFAGILLPFPKAPAGKQFPADSEPGFISSLYALRDTVYNGENPADAEKKAAILLAETPRQNLDAADKNLILSRIEYLAGRSWQEHGEKKKAIPYYESAIGHAQQSMAAGEDPAGLMALTKALSELCLLKDMVFLVANGPKISENAKKILALEPSHVGARVTLAAAKAYPPAIFGGNPKEAIAQMTALLQEHGEGFEKDDLFDIRTCIGTAHAKLGQKPEARFWFNKALELYPANAYAREEMEKLRP